LAFAAATQVSTVAFDWASWVGSARVELSV
jgi:hypothetical protein